jgi:hypothetical protein
MSGYALMNQTANSMSSMRDGYMSAKERTDHANISEDLTMAMS